MSTLIYRAANAIKTQARLRRKYHTPAKFAYRSMSESHRSLQWFQIRHSHHVSITLENHGCTLSSTADTNV